MTDRLTQQDRIFLYTSATRSLICSPIEDAFSTAMLLKRYPNLQSIRKGTARVSWYRPDPLRYEFSISAVRRNIRCHNPMSLTQWKSTYNSLWSPKEANQHLDLIIERTFLDEHWQSPVSFQARMDPWKHQPYALDVLIDLWISRQSVFGHGIRSITFECPLEIHKVVDMFDAVFPVPKLDSVRLLIQGQPAKSDTSDLFIELGSVSRRIQIVFIASKGDTPDLSLRNFLGLDAAWLGTVNSVDIRCGSYTVGEEFDGYHHRIFNGGILPLKKRQVKSMESIRITIPVEDSQSAPDRCISTIAERLSRIGGPCCIYTLRLERGSKFDPLVPFATSHDTELDSVSEMITRLLRREINKLVGAQRATEPVGWSKVIKKGASEVVKKRSRVSRS